MRDAEEWDWNEGLKRRRAEAADPETKPERLLALALKEPQLVLDNASLPLLSLFDPEVWRRITSVANWALDREWLVGAFRTVGRLALHRAVLELTRVLERDLRASQIPPADKSLAYTRLTEAQRREADLLPLMFKDLDAFAEAARWLYGNGSPEVSKAVVAAMVRSAAEEEQARRSKVVAKGNQKP